MGNLGRRLFAFKPISRELFGARKPKSSKDRAWHSKAKDVGSIPPTGGLLRNDTDTDRYGLQKRSKKGVRNGKEDYPQDRRYQTRRRQTI
jgi:hypothetical protein